MFAAIPLKEITGPKASLTSTHNHCVQQTACHCATLYLKITLEFF
jgi:hypothetical protein